MKITKHLMTLFVMVVAVLITNNTNAQIQKNDNAIGSNHVIESKALKQAVSINVYLPEGYHSGDTNYPVLYVLDGQIYGLFGAGFQQSLSNFSRAPEFIVVGIDNNDGPQRRQLFSGQSTQYLDFIEHEVITLIDKNYRTNADRMIFGWQMAGALLFELLAQRSHLFDAYFSASFTAYSDETVPAKLVEKFIDQDIKTPEYLYIVMAPTERWALPEMDELVALLKAKAPANLTWQQDRPDDEDHWSSAYKTLYKGIQSYYSDFEPIKFDSLNAFNEAGGLEHVKAHYKKRGLRYGLSPQIDDKTQFSLLSRALREDNIVAFDDFMTLFKGYLANVRQPNWGYRFGLFYSKHGQHDKALAVLNTVLLKFKDAAVLHNGLGAVYKAKGDNKAAVKHFQKAVDVARKNSDHNLADYEADLAEVLSLGAR